MIRMPTAPKRHDEAGYQGERLGLPETGIGSLATMGPRVLGLLIDWGIASGISFVWFDYQPLAITVAFVVLTWLFLVGFGSTIGHLVAGLRANTIAGDAPGIWRPLVRQVLLVLVIPALVVDGDGRGAHDVLSGLVLRRFR